MEYLAKGIEKEVKRESYSTFMIFIFYSVIHDKMDKIDIKQEISMIYDNDGVFPYASSINLEIYESWTENYSIEMPLDFIVSFKDFQELEVNSYSFTSSEYLLTPSMEQSLYHNYLYVLSHVFDIKKKEFYIGV